MIKTTVVRTLFVACLFGAVAQAGATDYYSIWTGTDDGTSWSSAPNWYQRTSDSGPVYAMATNASAVVVDADVSAATVWFNTTDYTSTGPILLSGGQLAVQRYLSFGANPAGGGIFCRTPGNIAHYFRATQNVQILATNISIIGGSDSAPLRYFDVGANEYSSYATQCEYTQTGGAFRVWTEAFIVGGMGTKKGVGTLDLAAVDNGVLKAINTANIGSFRGECRGTVALGRDWTVAFGTADAPLSAINVGYVSYNDSVAEGNLSMTGGSAEIYATNILMAAGSSARSPHYATMVFDGVTNLVLNVPGTFTLSRHGRAYNETINMRGLFDAYTCSNIVFDVGKLLFGITAHTGSSITGNGNLRLGRGRGTVGDLVMGTHGTASPVRAVMELNGMALSVTNFLNCGVSGIISNTVEGVSSGLALEGACASCATNVYLSPTVVDFTADPAPTDDMEKVVAATSDSANDWYWGMRWEGNHAAEIEALMEGAEPLLMLNTSGLSETFAERCGVHYSAQDDATYLGVPICRRSLVKGMTIILR